MKVSQGRGVTQVRDCFRPFDFFFLPAIMRFFFNFFGIRVWLLKKESYTF